MGTFHVSEKTREVGPNRRVRILRIEGDLDAHTFPEVQDRLEDMVANGERSIVLDCEALDYISSAGITVLQRMVKEVRSTGGDMRLAGLSEKIRSIINLLGFSKIIHDYADLDRAVASYE